MRSGVELDLARSVAHLVIDRRERGNALDTKLVSDIACAVDRAENTESVRALLISAKGPAFCVGGDVAHLVEKLDQLEQTLSGMTEPFHAILDQLARFPKPVIVAVHGGVGGGALGLLWCADYVLAADNSRFATGFATLGFSGDGGSSWFLPRLVGMAKAKEMLLENRIIDAETACEWGLVNRVTALEQLLSTAEVKAHEMASLSLPAFARAKRLLLQSACSSYSGQLKTELQYMLECARGSDVRAGLQAFAKREAPLFNDPFTTSSSE